MLAIEGFVSPNEKCFESFVAYDDVFQAMSLATRLWRTGRSLFLEIRLPWVVPELSSRTWRTAQWPVQPEGPWWSSEVGLETRNRQMAVEVVVPVMELLPGAGVPAKPVPKEVLCVARSHPGRPATPGRQRL